MPDLPEVSFAKAASKLKSPSSIAYVQGDWDAAYAASSKSASDIQLYESARWVAEEAVAARARFANSVVATLGPKWGTILAIAAHNREYRTALELYVDASRQARDAGVIAADTLASLRLGGVGGQHFTAAEFAQMGADATESWLLDAMGAQAAGDPKGDLAPLAVLATQAYTYRKAINSLWNDARHAGWHVKLDASGASRWVPGDRSLESLVLAWATRQEANLMNLPNIDRACWPALKPDRRRALSRLRGVVEIVQTKRYPKFKVAVLTYRSRNMPAYKYEKGALEGSYLADFVDVDMPAYPGLTVARLLLAWHVAYDIAKLLTKVVPLPSSMNAEQARDLALMVHRPALCEAIGAALQVEPDRAKAIVSFLTFQPQTGGTAKAKGNRGLWAAPLVAVPGTDEIVLPLSILATSNPARRAEAWLEKGGIDDSNPMANRGDRYEELYRDSIVEVVGRNTLFKTASCAPREIKKSKDFSEQVDLLISFGGLCLVAEVKFFLMPVDVHERERYDEKLRKAAEQAKRKTEALQARPDVVASALSIDLNSAKMLKLLPLVVTAQGYGFSTKVDDVRIVEAEFLRTYLSGDKVVTGMAMVPATGKSVQRTISFYDNEASAAARFEETVTKPYVLQRFLDRVKWMDTPFPALAHHETVIEVPTVDDVSGFERLQVEVMAAELG
jgi:hypothetical protein